MLAAERRRYQIIAQKTRTDRLVTNSFRDRVEAAEGRGASAEELRELLGRGRAKKGIFEGDLEEGELEIGQVAALFRRRQSVDEVMKELLEGYRRLRTRYVLPGYKQCREKHCGFHHGVITGRIMTLNPLLLRGETLLF